MLPIEDKSPPNNLQLNLNGDTNSPNAMTTSTVTIKTTAKNSNNNNNNDSSQTKIIHFEQMSVVKQQSMEIQRPTVLVKPKHQQPSHLSLDGGNILADGGSGATGNMASGSILSSSSGAGGSSTDDSKKVKMTKIGNTKSAALKR